MSSHLLDLSGARALTLTVNDPAVTKAYAPSKAGDDVEFSFSGREVRVALGANARIQKRTVVVNHVVHDANGKAVKDDDGNYVTEPRDETRFVLVLSGSASGFIRSSLTPDERAAPEGDAATPTYEPWTHTSVMAKRKGDSEWHYTEDGTLLSEVEVSELFASE